MKKINLKIGGMTCTSCEVLIERELKSIQGVHSAQVNHTNGNAVVDCDEQVTIDALRSKLPEKYSLYERSEQGIQESKSVTHPEKRTWAEIGAVFIILAGIYLVLKQLGISSQIGITDNMSYGFVFVLGLIAAMSTCLAVAGGLLLSVAAKYHEKYPNLTGRQKFIPHAYFNIGRIASYTILGGAIGALGSALTLSSQVTGKITIAASIFMILIGIQMLFPSFIPFRIRMPKFIAHRVYEKQETQLPSKRNAFLFGASTFFLPCGFTQALQLYVLSKGDVLTGAITMLAFSLGTMPSLLSIGALTSFAQGNVKKHVMTFAAVLVIMLGALNIQSGLRLTGAAPLIDTASNDITQKAAFDGEVQRIEMAVNRLDYVPDRFTIKKGVPVEWVIDGSNAQGCTQIITIPKLGLTERLSRSTPTTIKFTPTETGKLQFTCGMGMAGPGTFEVI